MNTGKSVLLLLCLMMALSTACSPSPPEDLQSPTNPFHHFSTEDIDSKRMAETVRTLSSPAFEGRLSGTEGNAKTMETIQSRFEAMGLESPDPLEDYRQPFTQQTFITLKPSELVLLDEQGSPARTFSDVTDFKLLTYFKSLKIEGSAEGGLIHLKQASDLSQSGKDAFEGSLLLFDEALIEAHGNVFALVSRYHHLIGDAAGWLFDWDIRSEGFFPISRLVRGPGPFDNDTGPLGLMVSEETADALGSAAEQGLSCRISGALAFKEIETCNLIGFISGSDPRKTLVLSAHLDHVGDNQNGTYNPGALDNASGIALLLETAEVMKAGLRPVHDVVFIAFNGEEEGLFGSRHYAEHPIFPLKNTCLVNLDMVGARDWETVSLACEDEALSSALAEALEEAGLPWEEAAISASDHTPFAERQVPAALLIDYDTRLIHRPVDTFENAVDPERLLKFEKALLFFMDQAAY